MVLTKKSVEDLQLVDLLLNIWFYSQQKNDVVCKQYAQWNIEIAKTLWNKRRFQNFDDVVKEVLRNDKSLLFDRICSAEKF